VIVIVYHAFYGCDTGCCGHRVELAERLEPEDLDCLSESPWLAGASFPARTAFTFSHPPSSGARAWAEQVIARVLGPRHVHDLDWEHCVLVSDCEGR
jgi:hypothetical protein